MYCKIAAFCAYWRPKSLKNFSARDFVQSIHIIINFFLTPNVKVALIFRTSRPKFGISGTEKWIGVFVPNVTIHWYLVALRLILCFWMKAFIMIIKFTPRWNYHEYKQVLHSRIAFEFVTTLKGRIFVGCSKHVRRRANYLSGLQRQFQCNWKARGTNRVYLESTNLGKAVYFLCEIFHVVTRPVPTSTVSLLSLLSQATDEQMASIIDGVDTVSRRLISLRSSMCHLSNSAYLSRALFFLICSFTLFGLGLWSTLCRLVLPCFVPVPSVPKTWRMLSFGTCSIRVEVVLRELLLRLLTSQFRVKYSRTISVGIFF